MMNPESKNPLLRLLAISNLDVKLTFPSTSRTRLSPFVCLLDQGWRCIGEPIQGSTAAVQISSEQNVIRFSLSLGELPSNVIGVAIALCSEDGTRLDWIGQLKYTLENAGGPNPSEIESGALDLPYCSGGANAALLLELSRGRPCWCLKRVFNTFKSQEEILASLK